MVLVRIADLAAQVEGPGSVSILLDILDHESTSVRAEAGEALLDVAYERFKEVAMAIEKALDQKRDGLSNGRAALRADRGARSRSDAAHRALPCPSRRPRLWPRPSRRLLSAPIRRRFRS